MTTTTTKEFLKDLETKGALLMEVKEKYNDICNHKEAVRSLVKMVKDYHNPDSTLMVWNHSKGNSKPRFKRFRRVFRKLNIADTIAQICRFIDDDIQNMEFKSEDELIMLLGTMYHIINIKVLEKNVLSDYECQLFLMGNVTGKGSNYHDDDDIIFSAMIINGVIEYHYCC